MIYDLIIKKLIMDFFVYHFANGIHDIYHNNLFKINKRPKKC